MITFHSDGMFNSNAEALVNTENCVGAAGRGVAETVKNRWPAIYRSYRASCGIGLNCNGSRDSRYGPLREQSAPPCCELGKFCITHKIRPGSVIAYRTNDTPIKFILGLPTKRHWYGNSRMEDVEAGIVALAATISKQEIKSIAIPPLGCGHGGLHWPTVRSKLITGLGSLDVDIRIYGAAP